MAVITLTRGFEAIVDDHLFDDLNSYNWHASGVEGRPARRLKADPRKIIFLYHQVLHILPWVMSKQGLVIDHLDGNPLNNQLNNLRICSQKENMRNTFRYGFREGISYDSTHNKYKAYIDQPDTPRINIGTFLTVEEAKNALIQAKQELGLEDN